MTAQEFAAHMAPIERSLRERFPGEMVMVKRWENSSHYPNHPDYDGMPQETEYDCREDFEEDWNAWAFRNPRAAQRDRIRRGCEA